jgi:hypothetical protein
MKEQTAVEWLIEQWPILESQIPERILEQAKEMEKEQIIEAYLKNHLQGCWMKNTPEEYAEQYYNETYESNNRI